MITAPSTAQLRNNERLNHLSRCLGGDEKAWEAVTKPTHLDVATTGLDYPTDISSVQSMDYIVGACNWPVPTASEESLGHARVGGMDVRDSTTA